MQAPVIASRYQREQRYLSRLDGPSKGDLAGVGCSSFRPIVQAMTTYCTGGDLPP